LFMLWRKNLDVKELWFHGTRWWHTLCGLDPALDLCQFWRRL
jgi:hypothetical protein